MFYRRTIMVRMLDITTLTEAEQSDIEFDRNEAGKVVAILKSYNSQTYTKLAQKVQRIEALEEEIKQLKAEVKVETRGFIAALFDAADAARTRVVNTISFILTLSKDPKPTESYQYAKIIAELEQHLTPDLIKVLSSLKEKFKTITQKEPSLKVTAKNNESIDEEANDGTEDIRPYAAKVLRFLSNYDSKIEHLRSVALSAR